MSQRLVRKVALAALKGETGRIGKSKSDFTRSSLGWMASKGGLGWTGNGGAVSCWQFTGGLAPCRRQDD